MCGVGVGGNCSGGRINVTERNGGNEMGKGKKE